MPLVLDRQIGDAAPRIEPVGRGKRRGRADVEAAPAGAAMVGLRRVGRELERGEDLAEEQPRAELRDTRLVCLPCQPSPARCASGFSITGAVSTKTFTSRRPTLRDPAAPAPSAGAS